MAIQEGKLGGRRLSRRSLVKAVAALAVGGAGVAAYARWIEPEWVEVVACDLPVRGLPEAWRGVRVGHIADLHRCRIVPLDYLARCIDQLAALKPDLVAVTGDFVMGPEQRYGQEVTALLGRLAPPLGVFACTGNHDFGVVHPVASSRPYSVVASLARSRVRLLRNEAVRLVREGEALWVAGIDDLWSGWADPAAALRDVPAGAANLVLCHNPDAAESLEAAGAGTILAGHTHGGQVHIPLLGPPILPVRNRRRYRGLHRVGRSWVYINRGLGWLKKVRFCCRPEITVLALRRATEPDANGGPASRAANA